MNVGAIGIILGLVSASTFAAPQDRWTEADLRQWRGAISMPIAGLPFGPRPGADDNTLFTAQGYDSVFDAATRARAREAFRNAGYTHWAYGPLVQRGYHGWWPDTDFRSDPSQFLGRARELVDAGIIPVLFLIDDQCIYACEHGRVNREAIERDLTPLYSRPEWQALFPVVVAAWEPQWSAADWQWVVRWMARTWPNALRYVHFPSGQSGPGRDDDLKPKGSSASSADLWNGIIPFIHGYLLQDTWAFTGDHLDAGRTREQQFVYDLLDKHRRFRYGAGRDAPTTGPEVDRWNATRGSDGKPYWQWDGTYLTRCAADRPLDVVAFEYASYIVKRQPERYAEALKWGALALTVDGIAGFGDGGPGRGRTPFPQIRAGWGQGP